MDVFFCLNNIGMINLKTNDSVNAIVHASQLFDDNIARDFIFLVKDTKTLEEITWFKNTNLSNTKRYDEYEITLSATTDVENGIIDLERGQYTFEVYWQTGSTLALSATTGTVLETGKMVVEFEPKNNYTTNDIYL
jgi:hypothetical protein